MEQALTILVAVIGFIGVLVGQVFVRGREVREMRSSAYVEWMRAARNLASWVGEEPKAGDVVVMPHPERLHRLNDCTSELTVVASRDVLEKADAYMEAFKSRFGGQQAKVTSARDAIDILEGPMRPHREELLRAMRRDLLPWWRPGQWRARQSEKL